MSLIGEVLGSDQDFGADTRAVNDRRSLSHMHKSGIGVGGDAVVEARMRRRVIERAKNNFR